MSQAPTPTPNELFSSGSLVSDPVGVPNRQAIDSLRGYAYQLYVSALAWIGLGPTESLYLEVAEDYAVVAGEALDGVQVKDDAASGSSTINSTGVLQALDSFIELREKNPGRRVTLRYLSTSAIGREQRVDARAGGHPVLEYWRSAAQTADVVPLRAALLSAGITQRVRDFIEARDDDQLRQDMLSRIHWDCGRPGIDQVRTELASALTMYGSDRLRLVPKEADVLPGQVLAKVFDTVLIRSSSERRLDGAALLRLCGEAGRTSVPTAVLEALVRRASGADGAGPAISFEPGVLEAERDVPLPSNVLGRAKAVREVRERLQAAPVAFLYAGTGMGKTILARLVARAWAGDWFILDLRDASAEECISRIQQALAESAGKVVSGLILDDLNHLDVPSVSSAAARLLTALRRRDAICLVTAYREPTSRTLERLGLGAAQAVRVPTLDVDEVGELVALGSGDASVWSEFVFRAGGHGHPQLVRAVLTGLQRRGWSTSEITERPLDGGVIEDLDSERQGIRQGLLNALPSATKSLLFRASLLHGRFRRAVAIELGRVEPQLAEAGSALDAVVGPWIDSVARNFLRVSPLVANVGEAVLSSDEQLAVHLAASVSIAGQKTDHRTANSLLVHALKGRNSSVLRGLATSVVAASEATRSRLLQWLPTLGFADVASPVYDADSETSWWLRFAQFFLLLDADYPAGAEAAWRALMAEAAFETRAQEQATLEFSALGKALISPKFSSAVPDWFLLLRRCRALTASGDLAALIAETEAEAPRLGSTQASVMGVMFIAQALHLKSVSLQVALFDQLDALDDSERRAYLDFALESTSGASSLINGPWLAEVRASTLDGAAAGAAYVKMASLAQKWALPALAAACYSAASMMLDEYTDDSEAALEILGHADVAIGANIELLRARARVYFRRRRHSEVLETVTALEGELHRFGPTERAFLCREAGISFAETNDWRLAAVWFGRAQVAALEASGEDSRAWQIGLKADHALAWAKAGEIQSAVALFAEVLSELPELDADPSLRAAYSSRVIRHGLLCLNHTATGFRYEMPGDGGLPQIVAGMCSNPNPSDGVTSLPRAAIEPTWYLFLPVEAQAVGAREAWHRLSVRLAGRSIPSLELFNREATTAVAIRSVQAADFVEQLVAWMGCWISLRHQPSLRADFDLERPPFGEVPPPQLSEFSQPFVVKLIRHATLTFAISAVISDEMDSLDELGEVVRAVPEMAPARELVERMLQSMEARDESPELPEMVCDAIRGIRQNGAGAPAALTVASLRFLQVVGQAHFRRVVDTRFVDWAQKAWRVALEARFAFNSPRVSIPEIRRALDVPGLSGIAQAIVAAAPALNIRLSTDFREQVLSLANGDAMT